MTSWSNEIKTYEPEGPRPTLRFPTLGRAFYLAFFTWSIGASEAPGVGPCPVRPRTAMGRVFLPA